VAYQEFQPDLRLRGLVQNYYQVSENNRTSEEHRFLPEQSVRLTFSSQPSWQGSPLGAVLGLMPEAALLSPTLLPQRVVSLGLTRSLGVDLYPWGARQLFGWSFGQGTVNLSEAHPWLSRAVCALVRLGCISLSWGRKSAMAERIECEWSVTIAPEGSQRGHPTCART